MAKRAVAESGGFTVHPDIRKARSLPPAAFIDPSFLEREFATVFAGSWHLVPPREAAELRSDPRDLAELVKRRGARAPVTFLGRPWFLQRDWEGTLRLFPNVCTHAWHPLVRGAERDRRITCPQHGRQFDCAGRTLAQAGFEGVDGFPGPEDHLRARPVAAWGDLLFASPGTPERPFEEAFAPVAESLARFPLDRLRRVPVPGESRELAGNWKQHAWNYMDSLHVPYIHRKPGGLAEALLLETYRTELHSACALQWAYARDAAHGFAPEMLPARFRDPAHPERRVFALWWFVFPDLTLNFYPWGLSVNVYEPIPKEPGRTLFRWYHYALDAEKYARREEIWLSRQVDDEDVDAMAQVLQGLRGAPAAGGRFSPKAEEGPHWFHRAVSTRVQAAPRRARAGRSVSRRLPA